MDELYKMPLDEVLMVLCEYELLGNTTSTKNTKYNIQKDDFKFEKIIFIDLLRIILKVIFFNLFRNSKKRNYNS